MIKRLEPHVVALIAAGESLPSPAAALKQLLENSLDAGATTLRVEIKEGGLQLLQISDDGSGIQKQNFELLCQRFATSKISSLQDLAHVGSFGFRGQALASLSAVADVTVKSRHNSSQVGFIATYQFTKLKRLEPAAMNIGTTITVTKLFEKLPVRRKSITPATERAKMLRLLQELTLQRLSLKVSFRSQKTLQFNSQVFQQEGLGKKALFASIAMIKIGQLFEIEQKCGDISVKAMLSRIRSQRGAKSCFSLIINKRIVESKQIERAVSLAYQCSYQSIHRQQLGFSAMVQLDIPQHMIDVNVHPSKKTVRIADQAKLCKALKALFQDRLRQTCSIKVLQLKQTTFQSKSSQSQPTGVQAHQKVRNDPLQLPLPYFSHSRTRKIRTKARPASNEDVSLFFRGLTLVGCDTINSVFFQQGSRLLQLDLEPILFDFVWDFVRQKGVFLFKCQIRLSEAASQFEQVELLRAETGISIQQNRVIEVPGLFQSCCGVQQQVNQIITAIKDGQKQAKQAVVQSLARVWLKGLDRKSISKIIEQQILPFMKEGVHWSNVNPDSRVVVDLKSLYQVFQRC